MKNVLFLSFACLLLLSACIKDDFIDDQIDPELSITTLVDTIALNSTFQFESRYLSNIGMEATIEVSWSSSDSNIISIASDGLATGISTGSARIIVTSLTLDTELSDTLLVHVGAQTVTTTSSITGTIFTTSSYLLEGSFVMEEKGNGSVLNIDADYRASTALPGLYLYLSNNRNSIANAYEVAKVATFSGAHSYDLADIKLNEYNFLVYYCKPFNIKVGEASLN